MNLEKNIETLTYMCTTLSLHTLFNCKIDLENNIIYITAPPMIYIGEHMVAEHQIFVTLMNQAQEIHMFVNEQNLPVIALRF